MPTRTENRGVLQPVFGIGSSRWLFILTAIVFRFGLELGYQDFVFPVYEYTGLTLELDSTKYLESWIIFVLLLALFPTRLIRVSDYMLGYLLFVFLSPLLVFYGLTNADRSHLYIVLGSVALTMIVRSGRPFRIPYVSSGRVISIVLMYAGILAVTVWMLASGGMSYFNLDFAKVYDFRAVVGEVLDQGPMAYLNTWATKVFGPIALALALWHRQFLLAFALVVLHVFWFGVSSHKAILFFPLLVVSVWLGFRFFRAIALMPFGMSLIIGVAYYFYIELGEIMPGAVLIHRVFFVPAELTFKYYEFFSTNPHVYWSESLTSWFLQYPYDVSTPKVIGAFRGNPEENANNSYLATGYMHAGVFGMAIYGILVGLIMRTLDSIAREGVPVWLVVACSIVPVQALLTSADLPPALLTHGLGVAILLLLLLRRPAEPLMDANRNARLSAVHLD